MESWLRTHAAMVVPFMIAAGHACVPSIRKSGAAGQIPRFLAVKPREDQR